MFARMYVCMYVCMYACMCVRMGALWTQVSICMCTQADDTCIDGFTGIQCHPLIDVYIHVCVHLSIFRSMYLERPRATRVGVRLCGCARGCARVRCIWLRVRSPFRMHRCVYHVHAAVCAGMRGHLLWIREPVRTHVCPLCGRTRVLCAAGPSTPRR